MADDVKDKDSKKETKTLSKVTEKLVDEISKLSVMELSELVNALQDKLGVSAMPVAAAAPSAGSGQTAADAPAQEAAGGGTLIMTASGDNKIAVIKALREINQNLSLMDAKGMTEAVPAEIIKDGKTEDVKAASEKLKAAGATFEVK